MHTYALSFSLLLLVLSSAPTGKDIVSQDPCLLRFHYSFFPFLKKKLLSPTPSLPACVVVCCSFVIHFPCTVRWGCSPSFLPGFSLQEPFKKSTSKEYLYIHNIELEEENRIQISIFYLFLLYPSLGNCIFDLSFGFLLLPQMRTIMAKTPHDSSFSFSRRYFHWKKKAEDDDDMEEILAYNSSSFRHGCEEELKAEELDLSLHSLPTLVKAPRKKLSIVTISKLRSAFTFGKSRLHVPSGLGTRVVCTLFGYRRGHVHVAFQEDAKLSPAFLVELATPTSALVREMASGLVRIALECEKKAVKKGLKLLDEPLWRAYCNGKKCGYAMRRECGADEWKVLNAVGPITMGAGVLPGSGNGGAGSEGELMYMRAKFERVVGSKDSEAFYMMSPDGNGGPELSIYLLRV